jgi:thioredoxin reductase (NADPH)
VKPFLNSRIVKITKTTVEVDQLGTPHSIPAQQVFLLTGYHTSTEFFRQVGVQFDNETLRPTHNTETFETNVPGVYLAGSVVGGRMNAEVFIENGRLHGEAIVRAIASKTN